MKLFLRFSSFLLFFLVTSAAVHAQVIQVEDLPENVLSKLQQARDHFENRRFAEAATVYEEVSTQFPELLDATLGLGLSLLLNGQEQKGLTILDDALEQADNFEFYAGIAYALETHGGKQLYVDHYRHKATQLALKVVNEGDAPPEALFIVAQDALEKDFEKFRRYTAQIVERFPDAAFGHYFNAIVAAKDHEWIKAESELELAAELGMPRERVDEFLDAGIRTRARNWRYIYYFLGTLGVWLVGMLILFVAGRSLSAITLRSIDKTSTGESDSTLAYRLRGIYRTLIGIAGLYYYVSMPIVLALTILIPGAILYGMFMLPRISIKLVVIVGLIGLITAFAAFKGIISLFSSLKDEDPGEALLPEDAPELWNTVREVADKVGTRPVDEIWLTPGTDLAVFERGTYRERLRDNGRRALILGVGTLDGFSRDAFCCVLAHEYGHFSHRDTAGGDVAMRVNNAMSKYAEAIIQAEAASWWNIGYSFLVAYHYLFRRISFGASRLQEVLADRVAVRNYGPKALMEGLKHVIRRSIEFEVLYGKVMENAVYRSQKPANFYSLPIDITEGEYERIEAAYNEILNLETTLDDTHPSPKERFALAYRLGVNDPVWEGGSVWELFPSRKALTERMHAKVAESIESGLAAHRKVCEAYLNHFTEIINTKPSYEVYFERAKTYLQIAQYEMALSDLDEASKLQPENSDPYAVRAYCYKQMQCFPEAIENKLKSLELSKTNPSEDDNYFLAQCELERRNFESAEKYLTSIVTNHSQPLTALLLRANARLELGKLDEAAEDINQAVSKSPNCAAAYSQRGLLYKLRGNYSSARADYERAVELEPRLAEAHLRLAWLLATCPDHQTRDGQLAVKHAKFACELNTDGVALEALDTLAAACARVGDFESATATLQHALVSAGPDDEPQLKSRLALYQQGQPFEEHS